MARMPRLYIEGCAQHLVRRGNNRSVCFFDTADYAFYCQKLKEAAGDKGVRDLEILILKMIKGSETLKS